MTSAPSLQTSEHAGCDSGISRPRRKACDGDGSAHLAAWGVRAAAASPAWPAPPSLSLLAGGLKALEVAALGGPLAPLLRGAPRDRGAGRARGVLPAAAARLGDPKGVVARACCRAAALLAISGLPGGDWESGEAPGAAVLGAGMEAGEATPLSCRRACTASLWEYA